MANDFLNMRQGPGLSYPLIQRLQNGVEVAENEQQGVVGWVNALIVLATRSGG